MGEITSFPIQTKTIDDLEVLSAANAQTTDQLMVFDESAGVWKVIAIGDVVKGSTILLDSVSSLAQIDGSMLSNHQSFQLKSFSPTGFQGGGFLVWDPTIPKLDHDGERYFSPSVPAPTDFNNQTQVNNYKNGIGEMYPTENGVFVLTKSTYEIDQVDTYADISKTRLQIGQVIYLNQHTSGGLGGGEFIGVSSSGLTPNNGTISTTASVGVFAKRINYENLTFEMFGAIGDGIADDTGSILSAIAETPSGGNLRGRAASYRITQTIVFTKPINLHLATKESARFLVDPGGSYLGAPYNAALYFPATSSNTPSVGNSIRSVMSGFTVTPNGSSPSNCYGILNSTVVYFYEVDVNFMSSAGFATIAGNGSPIPGNANGTTWNNCGTYLNGSHGWYALGDDVNQCTHYRSVGAGNGGYGFYDDGLLGNTYVGCEVIANTIGGYFVTSAKPNRSSFFNCYAEEQVGALLWNISVRCLRFGSTGFIPGTSAEIATGGIGLTAQATSPAALFSTHAFSTGESATVAGNQTGGKWASLGQDGLGLQGRTSGLVIRLKDVSTNYAALVSGATNLMLFPYANVTENISTIRPFLPNGLTFGTSGKLAFVGEGTAAPTTGAYTQGAIFMNTNPVASGFIGWICVANGSPGTWKTWGAISA